MDNRPDPHINQLTRVLVMALGAFITIESMLVAMLFRFDAQVPGAFWIRF